MEAVNGVADVDKGAPPPPSPLTGCYLLIVIGEPHCNEHKDIILQKVAKGLLSWDVNDCLVDLEKELAIITEQALEGEEARYGERLIQFASENLVTEILIHPVVSTLAQCVRNLLSSFTRHRHIIHAGYTFANNGSWILQDGTFSLADFCEAFQEIEVLRVIRAYENGISLHIHCAPEGDWTRLPKETFTKGCKVRVNPNDVLTAGTPLISNFINYLQPFLIPAELENILESSDVVGNIRFSRPTLYVFPGGQGDAALFGINGFNMLLDGGFSRKACFWDFVRHLDRLDAVLLTRLNNSNVNGISAVLRRKKQNAVYPQIGHFFCNIQERKAILSPDGDKDKDPLLINLLEEGQEIVSNLRHLSLTPQVCYRDSEPINLYHKVGHGTLDMYVLSPAKDSKEVREFLQKWNNNDQKLFANQKSIKDFVFPLQNLVSICALLVWQPANPEDTITRILFPGSSPQNKIFEGLDKIKNLEFIKHPVCSEKSLVPASVIKSKQTVLDKILPLERKPLAVDNKREKAKLEIIENGSSGENGDVQVEKEKVVKKSDSTESEKSLTKPKKILENGADKPKAKPKDIKPKVRSDSQQRKLKTAEKKPSPTTPKKTVDKGNADQKSKFSASPSATPAKSTKEANNRKVLESKTQKSAPKKDLQAKQAPEKKDVKVERKPISRRPKETPKVPASPSKKVNGIQKPDSISKRSKLDKEGTTDSSTVSTPSADQDSILKKDISKLTPDELQKLKAQELADLQEEQEAVKEIEAVFRKSELQDDKTSDFRKIKDLSIDDKLESEEYLIIEKTEVEEKQSVDETKEDETQKMARDSEESEKQRKLSGEIQSKEANAIEQNRVEIESEVQKIITSASDIVKAKDEVVEASKEISATSPEDKIDNNSTDKKDQENEVKETAPESLPDEKGSANIESGATTTAPTLPEDERMPLDEIKEDNGDQMIEEKHVKENTKEKDVPVIQLPPKTFEAIPKLPPVVGIRLDKQSHIRDIVKTPDEVADLPVHEEVDIGHYDEYNKEQEVVKKDEHDEPKKVDSVKATEEKTEEAPIKIIETSKPDETKVEEDVDEKKDTAVILQDLNKKELSKSPDEEKDTDEHELKLQKEENDKATVQPAEVSNEEEKVEKDVEKVISPDPSDFNEKVSKESTPKQQSKPSSPVCDKDLVTEIKDEKVEASEKDVEKADNVEIIPTNEIAESQISKTEATNALDSQIITKDTEMVLSDIKDNLISDKTEIIKQEKEDDAKEFVIKEAEKEQSDIKSKTPSPTPPVLEENIAKKVEDGKSTDIAVEPSKDADIPKTDVTTKSDDLKLAEKLETTDNKEREEQKTDEKKTPTKEDDKIETPVIETKDVVEEKDEEKITIIEKSETETKEKKSEVSSEVVESVIKQLPDVPGHEIVATEKQAGEVTKKEAIIIEKVEEKVYELNDIKEEELVSEIVRVDRKIEQVQHAEPVIIAADSNPESPMVERPIFEDLGRKSPKEREEDVAKIVVSVAKVLKSDAPLEEFEGKIPFTIPYKTYTTELRETHITTVDSPVTDERRRIDDPVSHKASSLTFIEEERKISAIDEEVEPIQETKKTDLMKESEELMKATSKMISDIKRTQSKEDVIVEEEILKEDDNGTVHRMLVTTSSEDGGEEIEICPPGTITFSRSSESSGRSSPDPQSSRKASQISSFADTFSEGATVIDKTVKGILPEKAKEDIKTKIEEVKETAEHLTNGVDEKVSDFEQKIGNLKTEVQDIKKEMSGIVNNIKDNASKVVEDVTKTVTKATGKLEKDSTEFSKKEILKKEDLVEKSVQQLEADVSSKKNEIEEKLDEKLELGAKIIGEIKEPIEQTADQLKEVKSEVIKNVESQISNLTSTIDTNIKEIKEDLSEKVTELSSSIESKISKDVTEKVEEVKDNVDDLKTNLSNTVSDLKESVSLTKQEVEETLADTKFNIFNGLEKVEKMVVDVITADREEILSAPKDASRKSSVASVEKEEESLPIAKTIEKEIEDVKDALKNVVKDTVEQILQHDAREDVLEKAAEDLEKNYENVTDMAKSMVFEKCDLSSEKHYKECEDVLEKSAVDLEETYEATINMANSLVFDKCAKPEDNLQPIQDSTKSSGKSTPEPIKESDKKDSEHHEKSKESSGKSSPDVKEERKLSIMSEKSDGKASDILSGKSSPEIKTSGKLTPEHTEKESEELGKIVENSLSHLKEDTKSISGKSTPDIKDSNISGKATPDISHIIKDYSGKSTPDIKESVTSGIPTPDLNIIKDALSGKSTPDLKDLEEIQNAVTLSGKSTPATKESLTSAIPTPDLTNMKDSPSGKSTPDLKEILSSEIPTPDLAHIKDIASGKSTPDHTDLQTEKIKSKDFLQETSTKEDTKDLGKNTPESGLIQDSLNKVEINGSQVSSGKVTPSLDDVKENLSVDSSPEKVLNQVDKLKSVEHSDLSGKSTPDIKDSLISSKDVPDRKDSIPSGKHTSEIKDSISSGKETPEIKDFTSSEKQMPDNRKDSIASGKHTPENKETIASGKQTPDGRDSITSGKETPEIKDFIASGKQTPDVKDCTFSGKVSPDKKDSILSGKQTPENKESILSGKATPEIKDSTASGKQTPDRKDSLASGKQTPDRKDSIASGKETPVINEIKKDLSGKSTPDLSEHKQTESIKLEDSLMSGKATPDLKDSLMSGKETPDLKDSLLSGKATPEFKDSLFSGKETPELKDSLASGKATPILSDIKQDLSGKSTPDLKAIDKLHEEQLSGKSTPDIKDSLGSGKSTPDLKYLETKIENNKKHSISDEIDNKSRSDSIIVQTSTSDRKDSIFSDGKISPTDLKESSTEKEMQISEKIEDSPVADLKETKASERKDSVQSEKANVTSGEKVDDTAATSLKSSPGISGKSTPDVKEENKDSLLSGKSSPNQFDVKELDDKQLDISIKSDSVLSSADKESIPSSSPDKPETTQVADEKTIAGQLTSDFTNLVDKTVESVSEAVSSISSAVTETIEESFDMTKSIVIDNSKEMSQLAPVETVKKLSVSDVEITLKEEPKIPDNVSMTASFIESSEVEKAPTQAKSDLSSAVVPPSAKVDKIPATKESKPHISDSSIPPVPASPNVKELSSTQPEEKTPIKSITSLKESEVRSYTPGSDDYDVGVSTYSDISSGQVSKVPPHFEADKIESDEDDDIPGSPMSVTSQVPHSRSSSRYDFDDERIGTKMDPMNTSFYGALPDDNTDLDYEKALAEHRQSRGEDLVAITEASNSYLYELTKAKFTSSTSDLHDQAEESLDQINKNGKQQQSDLMTASFMGDLPSEPPAKKDPFDSWGKPLGLPSPAPPSDNKGTPKKERKLPSNVSAKNKLNDDKKRADSPSKYKNKKSNPVYVDLTYVPHHGNGYYSYVDFFKKVRARYYVFSGIEPSREVYNALLEAKQTWEDKELEVTIIPTYDTDILGYWVAENEELLTKCKIDLSPSASRCTINLQDHETSCSAYRLEF